VKHKIARGCRRPRRPNIKKEKGYDETNQKSHWGGPAACGGIAFAQTAHTIRVKVPFPFVTAGKSWSAGDYRVQIRTDNSIVTLNSPGMASATVLTTTDDRSGERRTYLRFQRYADHWVPQEVTIDGMAQVLTSGELTRTAKLKTVLSRDARRQLLGRPLNHESQSFAQDKPRFVRRTGEGSSRSRASSANWRKP
jgi:hypothetical protein